MRSIAFAAIKGGVGKTTLAVHVAAALADSGKNTLLIDLDPQGHATSMAGLELPPDAPCVADTFGTRARLQLADVIVATERERLVVAPATSRMVGLERELFRWGHRLKAIPRSLEPLRAQYDAVVIDTPPQLNAFSEAALASGDAVVVPVPAMAHALQGLDEIVAAHQDVSEGAGGHMLAAVNLWDRRTTATNEAMEEAFADLPVPLARSRIPRAEVLNQAGLAYQLIYDFAPNSEVAERLAGLAREVWRIARR
jgi:chromosome partitioning protein